MVLRNVDGRQCTSFTMIGRSSGEEISIDNFAIALLRLNPPCKCSVGSPAQSWILGNRVPKVMVTYFIIETGGFSYSTMMFQRECGYLASYSSLAACISIVVQITICTLTLLCTFTPENSGICVGCVLRER